MDNEIMQLRARIKEQDQKVKQLTIDGHEREALRLYSRTMHLRNRLRKLVINACNHTPADFIFYNDEYAPVFVCQKCRISMTEREFLDVTRRFSKAKIS